MTTPKSHPIPHAVVETNNAYRHAVVGKDSTSPPISFQQAAALARNMRDDLRPHTKDRKWRFKSYSNCFKGSHAVVWAQENTDATDGSIAISLLNQLIDYGLLCHVVDPSKKLRVRDTRTLYFRIAIDEELDRNR